MKKIFAGIPHTKFIAAASAFTWAIAMANSAGAAQLQEARVTQVVNDVKLLLEQAAPRPAVVSDLIRHGNAVRTGTQSRSELTFADLTITRLGANTIFSFKEGTREMNLIDGAILFQVPKGSGGATIRTVGVTAAITGTTGIAEFHPATTSHPQLSKWLCLEGTFHLYLPNGQSVELGPGKIVTSDGKSFSKVMTFDIAKLVSTSLFFTGFDQPLASMNLIMLESENQLASSLLATTTTNPLDPTRIVNVINQAIVAEEAQTSPPASPTPPITPTPPVTPTPSITPPPTPSKFGTPTVITSPNPYLITSGTVITTDPSITTNGVTDYGKIYRGPADDGAFSLWAFGSTSAFDTASGFDAQINNSGAGFKFTALQLTGDPTIDTTGGEIRLALIAVNGITSGGAGGVLTFAGLESALLATQNGSINLGSGISFAGSYKLTIYARGSTSDLMLDSDINISGGLHLYAERDITATSNIETENFSAVAGRNITVDTAGNLTVNGGDGLLFTIPNNNRNITTGGNIALTTTAGGDLLLTNGNALFTVQNTGGTIGTGGNITLTVGGSVSTQGQLSLLVENYNETANPAGHIGTGGNVSLTTGGNLTADSMSVAVNNRGGGMIDSGVNLAVNVGGALTTLHNGPDFIGNNESLSLAISSRYDDQFGNTDRSFIGGDATLLFHSDSASIGGILAVIISDRGGTIDGNALLNFSVTRDITIQGADNTNFEGNVAAAWQILNDDGPPGSGVMSPFGGTIHGSANLLLSATNLTITAGSLEVDILNRNAGVSGPGGTIDSDANIFTLTGNLSTHGSAFFGILNQLQPGGTTGGTIGGDATINVTAANISTGVDSFGSSLDGLINNATGNIGGSAIVFVDVTNDITAQGPANFQILNNDGGHIGGSADILVTTGGGGNLTADSIFAFINNRNDGSIDSGASLAFSVGGTLTTTGDATFGTSNRNDGSGGGTIGSLATVDINAGSISVGGFFQTFISTNGGGSIQGDAINVVNSKGDLTAQDGILLDITTTIFGGTGNFTGGHIGGNAIVALGAQNIITPSTASGVPGTDTMALEASIYPNASGTVGGDAIVNVFASQDISAPGSVLFWVANGNYQNLGPGMIGGNAEVDVSASNISTGDFFDQILNYGGASIGGDATINITANNISTDGSLSAAIDNSSGLGSGFTGATIGGDAAINITAANLTANSLVAQIDNTGGSIGANTEGGAMINMNVSGNATITNDATVAIYGSDGAVGGAGININGGNYNVGGTFLSYIDGNGTITFNNASAHADVLKAGVFGTNGVLRIGGGTLSADSTLKLYAPGSNGQLNFISNVTLGGNSTKILAANSVTIFDNVVVTIGGSKPADVYTGFNGEIPNANYTGFGGNGSTTGTFAGAGANDPQPLSKAPPFGTVSRATVRTGGNITTDGNGTRGKKVDSVIHVSSSDELLSLLDGAAPGPGGKITIPRSKGTRNSRNSNRTDVADRLKAGSRVNADRRAMDMRTASSSVIRRSPQ